MNSIRELAETLQALLTSVAEKVAQESGFIRRRRKVTGAGFVQGLVFSFLEKADATREELNQGASSVGLRVSTTGLDKRLDARGAAFLGRMVEEAVGCVVRSSGQAPSVLSRLSSVQIVDTSTVALPSELAAVWPGCNGAEAAAVKLAVKWDVGGGALNGVWLTPGRQHDQKTPLPDLDLATGGVRLMDLGFFNLATFRAIAQAEAYFFSRFKVGTRLYWPDGSGFDLLQAVRQMAQPRAEWSLHLGQRERLPVRLVAIRVPPEVVRRRRHQLRQEAQRKQQPLSSQRLALASWTLYVTNIPPHLLTLQEAPILGMTRWQIELLFKRWKSDLLIDQFRSTDPWRVLCEFYAKLLTAIVQHWLLLVSCASLIDRSFHRAAQVIRKFAFCLALALSVVSDLVHRLEQLVSTIQRTCRLHKRKTKPLTFQFWLGQA